MKYKVIYKEGMGTNGADLLQFEGALTIQNMQSVKKSLLDQLVDCQALQVVVKNAEQFDFSFFQLLIGLKIKFKEEQRPICFQLDLEEDHKRFLISSGFNDLLLAKY